MCSSKWKPAILYPEAALVSEARRILTFEIGLEDKLKLSFKDSRGFLSRLGLEGEIIHMPGHSDDNVSLILDEGTGLNGYLAG